MVQPIAVLLQVASDAAVMVDDLVDLDHAVSDRYVENANVFLCEVELPAGFEAVVVAVEAFGLVEVLDQEPDVVKADKHGEILLGLGVISRV